MMINDHDLGRDTIRQPIAELRTPEDVLQLPPVFNGGFTEAEFLHIGRVTQTMWRHDGDQKKPHAILTSGLCSDGYFDIWTLLTYPNVGEILAQQMVRMIERELGYRLSCETVDFVVSSDHSGAAISRDVGRLIGCRNDFAVKQDVWTRNEQGDLEKTGECQRWTRSGSSIKAGGRVLHPEELVST